MKHLKEIQQAIDFIEENLFCDISYSDAANHLHISGFHFHRLFSMTTGLAFSEYVRKRRLSLAGQELIAGNAKIIDLAYKYGYESPESFSKAFTAFHGHSPSAIRRGAGTLLLFNRLVAENAIKGGLSMEYRIVEQESFRVLAEVRSFRNEIASDPCSHAIPDFWDECIENDVIVRLRQYSECDELYGICSPVSADAKHFEYGIGVRYNGAAAPDGFRIIRIKPTRWAVFKCIGTDGSCISETWDRIFKEFLPESGYKMLDDADFELYPADNSSGLFCEVWVPIARE